ncbi:MAG: ATP-dependent helicase [Cellvibrionaceae bacterium]|nr:ATP-dependent helicase [Cellvibrionaceae bacterium]|tara:strand:+ start:15531 stop:17324 length:1794 start_codon:yes stop_codon:yes gene_type:complete
MSYRLRPYQQEAVTATIKHFRSCDDAAVIVLPTGAGKSLVIAELARLANHRILVITHVKELVEQNHQKYESYGVSASIFSAGLNRKENHHQVVFGSVQSVAQNLDQFDGAFSLIIVDECHRVSLEQDSQYQVLIHHLKQTNPQLKVLGLTATPYRLDSGWIYQQHLPDQRQCTTEPTPFSCCIYELPLSYMIKNGYLTRPQMIDAPIAHYDFESLRNQSPSQQRDNYKEADLNRIIKGSKRATAKIIDQIITQAEDRMGVMIFAATTLHAKEILGYLPTAHSALILGDMRRNARDGVIRAFKEKQIKFLVNVSVLTTGFDAPHVDLIAILRPTDSVGLYQQMVGRGLRLNDDKADCLVLDYAGNTHDLYRPRVDTPKPNSDSEAVTVHCPYCGHANNFWGKTDGDGKITEHYGRRCQGLVDAHDISTEKDSALTQCSFRFRFKECPQCGGENDIAARQCGECQQQLIDPDDKLKQALQLKDLTVLRCSGMSLSSRINKKSQQQLCVTYHDEDGAELTEYFSLTTDAQQFVFARRFLRQHLKDVTEKIKITAVEEALCLGSLLRHPDFVIARKEKYGWQIREKIFDYEGRFRRANEIN